MKTLASSLHGETFAWVDFHHFHRGTGLTILGAVVLVLIILLLLRASDSS